MPSHEHATQGKKIRISKQLRHCSSEEIIDRFVPVKKHSQATGITVLET